MRNISDCFLRVVCAALVCLTGLSDACAIEAPQAQAGVTVTDENMIEAAKTSIRQQEVNPESVEYRNISVHFLHKPTLWLSEEAQAKGYRAVCGEVRAKGLDGNMTPFTRFFFINLDTVIGVRDDEWAANCS